MPAGVAIRFAQGDFCDDRFVEGPFEEGFDCISHLAATLMLDAEGDFAQGLEVNLLALVRAMQAEIRSHPDGAGEAPCRLGPLPAGGRFDE